MSANNLPCSATPTKAELSAAECEQHHAATQAAIVSACSKHNRAAVRDSEDPLHAGGRKMYEALEAMERSRPWAHISSPRC
jgi:hypothetical protein